MNRRWVFFIVLILVGSALFAESAKQRISLGGGAGLFKNLEEYDYKTVGQGYGGHLKYGISHSFELGVSGYYEYHYPADILNEHAFPFQTRTVDGPMVIREHPAQSTTHRYDTQAEFSFEREENVPLKFTYIPIDFYLHFRAMWETIFNPFVVVGGGYMMWKAEDIDYPDATVEVFHDGSWKEYAGNHFDILFGLGAEIFPVPQVGIDFGLYGHIPFLDDFAKDVTDTLYMKVDARAHINFYYGGITDADKDGVIDKKDECPDTPLGATVDEIGCPSDSDGDGVYDGLDQCPATPLKAIVDAKGCPLDTDGDGVYDGIDKCTGTPPGAKVDEFGCAVDSDGDGVPDYKDSCPNTPSGATVDVNGCPFDTDADGVYDGIDKCPNTPIGTQVNQFGCPMAEADEDGDGIGDSVDRCPNTPKGAIVDEFGCPVDTDKDGVMDYEDDCPSTPQGAYVDARGCPSDKDGDGVFDGLDKCPNTMKGAVVDEHGCAIDRDDDGVPDGIDECPGTPKGAIVNSKGCPLDTDGDGVYDGIDKCPNTPEGVEVDEFGCRKLEKGQAIKVRVHFESCKWDITPKGEEDLAEAKEILLAHPEMKFEIGGHTDNQKPTGECARAVTDNMGLSNLRARSVYDWLIELGVSPTQLDVQAYGGTQPVASNSTSEGRAQNRRIEFKRLK